MKRLALSIAAALTVAGCQTPPTTTTAAPTPLTSPAATVQQVVTFTLSDVQAAQAQAAKAGDTQAANCFGYVAANFSALVAQTNGATPPVGAVTAFETGRLALNNLNAALSPASKQAMENACGPLALDVQNQGLTFAAEFAAVMAMFGVKIAVPAAAGLPLGL